MKSSTNFLRILWSEYKKQSLIFALLFLSSSLYAQLLCGADQPEQYLPRLKNKKVAVVVNQTSCLHHDTTFHLVDFLIKNKINIRCIFAPEHGFRGNYEAGAAVKNDTDTKTGIAVLSLYGKNKKPTAAQLSGIDVVLFDIQDVGVRFYTYISTLHYVMEACAEQNKPLIILDRPNPNGFYVDGPVLESRFASFVGMHPVPVVHGMTIGEYARMINGEKWLKNKLMCALHIVRVKNYTHSYRYTLPVAPSPNLRTMTAIYLYPTLCFLEGTSYSLGRGTDWPFECAGKPGLKYGNFEFTPVPLKGVADNPPYANTPCRGIRYSELIDSTFFTKPRLLLNVLLQLYTRDNDTASFFTPFFDKLAGNNTFRQQLSTGIDELTIRGSWASGLSQYMKTRKKYLIYSDK